MFWITIKEGWKQYRYLEHIPIDERTEHFKVHGRNGYILIESNRPLFRSKGLKKRRPDFKVVEGQLRNIGFLEKIMEAVYSQIEQ